MELSNTQKYLYIGSMILVLLSMLTITIFTTGEYTSALEGNASQHIETAVETNTAVDSTVIGDIREIGGNFSLDQSVRKGN